MGLIYSQMYSILGDSPLPWQIYSYLLRLTGALVLFWILRQLWSKTGAFTALAAILFVVYPGFLQQPNGNTFSNQLLGYTLSLVSIAFTLLAVRATRGKSKVLWYSLALGSAVAYWLIYEYMIGMEAFRVVAVWVALDSGRTQRIRATIRSLLPFAPPLMVYLGWRVFAYESGRGVLNTGAVVARFRSDLPRSVASIGLEWGKDILETSLAGWAVPVYQRFTGAGLSEQWVALVIGAFAAGLFIAYSTWLGRSSDHQGSRVNTRVVLVAGLFIILVTTAPVIIAGRDVHWHSGFDRYTLHVTVGIALLMTGLIWLVASPRLRPWIGALLILISVGTHYLNALHWEAFWESQRQMWWQLSWRAPDLRKGTLLTAEIPVDGFLEDYEIWGPANLIYSQSTPTIEIAAEIMNEETAEKIRFGSDEIRAMRAIIQFEKDFDNTLILAYPSFGSCLHVIDGRRLELPRTTSGLMKTVARFSDIGQIVIDTPGVQPPATVFGPEPDYGWCYYFQKADLARQAEDWNEVVRLGDEARRLGLRPSDRSEWMPFLDGYAVVGDKVSADEVATLIRQKEPIRRTLCENIKPGLYPTNPIFDHVDQILCEFD